VSKKAGSQLKNSRKAAGLSQKVLAERIGCHFQHLSAWERGVVLIPQKFLAGIKENLPELDASLMEKEVNEQGESAVECMSRNANILASVLKNGLNFEKVSQEVNLPFDEVQSQLMLISTKLGCLDTTELRNMIKKIREASGVITPPTH
jgi:transcriptional regulator with XRE-family HTH domain